MTTIHLTDTQCDTFAACGLIVVPGECRFCTTVGHDAYWLSMHRKCRESGTVAPEGWRILTVKCDGSGSCPAGIHLIGCWKSTLADEANEFFEGLPIVTFTATCHSHRYHAIAHQPPKRRCPQCCSPDVWCVDNHDHFECKTCGYGCDKCGGTGKIEFGDFTILALLPVCGNEHTPRPPEYAWVPGDGSLQHAVIGRTPMFSPLPTPDPLPRPGQFIAIPEPVE